jgi:SAM-dependent methyltransferase
MTGKNITEFDWLQDSKSFDSVSDLYDRFRPSYPPEMIDNILAVSNIPAQGRILEVGSGTGKATRLFAQRNYTIHCIEPGENLTRVAAHNLQEFRRVDFEHFRFEDWQEKTNYYDLFISAQAFHWVNWDTGLPKAARSLKSEGYLALFWNMYPGFQSEIAEDLNRIYHERVPEWEDPWDHEDVIKQRMDAINTSGCFEPVTVERYPWSIRYSCHEYLGLLNTYSDHLRLSEAKRKHLFDGVAEVIEQHGGFIERPYLAVLYMARKKT